MSLAGWLRNGLHPTLTQVYRTVDTGAVIAAPLTDFNVRRRLLDEATRLFAGRGAAGTPLTAIAKAAGVSKPTLLYHFGSKAGLRAEVLDQMVAHWREELPRRLQAHQSAGDRLDGLLDALFHYFEEDETRATLFQRELLDNPSDIAALLREHLQPLTAVLTEAIVWGQGQDRVRSDLDPPSFVVLVVLTTLNVFATSRAIAALTQPEPDAPALRAELRRITRAALLPPRS